MNQRFNKSGYELYMNTYLYITLIKCYIIIKHNMDYQNVDRNIIGKSGVCECC